MFFKESELFRELESAVLHEIADKAMEVSYNRGEFVLREGDPAEDLFILNEGKIRLSVGEAGQMTYLLDRPGEVFGWSSLVDRRKYTASAECLEACRLLKIHREALLRIFEKYPASGMLFYRRLAGLIGERLMATYRTLLASYQPEGPPSYG